MTTIEISQQKHFSIWKVKVHYTSQKKSQESRQKCAVSQVDWPNSTQSRTEANALHISRAVSHFYEK